MRTSTIGDGGPAFGNVTLYLNGEAVTSTEAANPFGGTALPQACPCSSGSFTRVGGVATCNGCHRPIGMSVVSAGAWYP